MSQIENKRSFRSFLRNKFTVEVRNVTPDQRKNLIRLGMTLAAVGFILFIIILVQVIRKTGIVGVDHSVVAWIATYRHEDVTVVMRIPALIFGPVLLPIIVTVTTLAWFIFSKHAWRPIIFSVFMGFGLLLVALLKNLVQRERPPLDQMLLGKDYSFSFPSGHVLGTSDFVLFLLFLFISRSPSRKKVLIGIVAAVVVIGIQVFSRTYLGYHWLSDTLGSISVSLFVLGLLILVDTRRTVKLPHEPIEGDLSKLQTDNT